MPGVNGWGFEDKPPLDPVAKSLRDASIRAQADPAGTPLVAVQRYEILQASADLLPPSAKLAHEAGILGRHHTEAMLPSMLKQVGLDQAASPSVPRLYHQWFIEDQAAPPRVSHTCTTSGSLRMVQLIPQVVHKAKLQLPHSATTYHEPEGCVILSCFAGSYERRDGGGLPVAITFSTYCERVVQANEKGTVSERELSPEINHFS